MAIEFATTTRAAQAETSHSVGGETFELSAGKQLQIRDNETGEVVNRLSETVPAGKAWSVTIDVAIAETDA